MGNSVFVLGREPMTVARIAAVLGDLPDDFIGPLEWKRFPEYPDELHHLLDCNPCVIDFDTLDDESIEMVCNAAQNSSGIICSFWIYSRKDGTMKLIMRGYKSPLVSMTVG
ncbi:MAG: hypothetical protein V1807_02675 [Patescibacteria group bacterium]